MLRRANIEYVQFSILSSETIKKLSVCEVTLPASGSTSNSGKKKGSANSEKISCDKRQHTPYDTRMGSLENNEICATCGHPNMLCPGHFGHISLPFPVANITVLPSIIQVLQSVCSKCGRLRVLPQFAVGGFQSSSLKCFSEKGKKVFKCPWSDCQTPLYGFLLLKDREIGRYYRDPKSAITPLSDGEALAILKNITDYTSSFLGIGNVSTTNPEFIDSDGKHRHNHHPKDFILTELPVIPPAARPYIVKDGQICDDDLTEKYNTIVKLKIKYLEYEKKKATKGKNGSTAKSVDKTDIAKELRRNVHNLMMQDAESKQSTTGRQHKSIEIRLGKKEGQIQTNVAGKRCDFTARNVIMGGGILLKDGEFGVPKCIASEITYPELVVSWNKNVLQKLVKRGLVNKIERRGPDGNKITLRLLEFPDKGCDIELKLGDIVRRQLIDEEGWYDTFIANRQPSLRSESMKGYRLKIIEGNAYRLPEKNTKSFNADYDGDEMNLHFAQSIGANVEIRVLLKAPMLLITAQRNGPVDGVVQDGLVGSLLLTNTWNDGHDTFVNVELYKNIVHGCGLVLTKSFYKRASWYYPDYVSEDGFKEEAKVIPGKLAFSILFPETLRHKAKTDINPNFPFVKISYGIMKPDSGPMCSKSIGSKQLSITHRLWKEYSPDIADRFLSDVQQFTNRWLPNHGFSIGVRDCTNTQSELIAQTFAQAQNKVNAILERCGGIPSAEDECEIVVALNCVMNIATKIGNEGMTGGEKNALNVMRLAGAKGSNINLMQITACVGPQIINGKRIQLSLCGGTRTLPHCPKGDHGSDSKGMVFSNYLNGYTPKEGIFHAMSGREGVIATGVKTAETGYIQKRIMKKVEDYSVWIDGSVRDANGRIIQFMYGDDGMDAKKIYNVKGVNYPFCVNPQAIADQLNAKFVLDGGKGNKRNLTPEEINFLVKNFISAGHPYQKSKVIRNQTRILRKNISELLGNVTIYEENIPELCSEINKAVECSKAQYGEMIGIIAGTSLGEPTTQMVLNVFHSAGVSGKDVSLGIPRFNEVLNATKSDKQKKPSATIYFTEEYKSWTEDAFSKFVKKEFEGSIISDFLRGCELHFVGEEDAERWSPASPVSYPQYEKPWWSILYEKTRSNSLEEKEWVLFLNFDVKKLYNTSTTLLEIAEAINSFSEGKYFAIPSPTCVGKVEVRCNFELLEDSIEELVDIQQSVITKKNVYFFIMRDVCLEYIKKLFVSGIKGVSKVFLRKEGDEWVVDASLARATMITAQKRFLEILTHFAVDSTRTVCDDMHTQYATFGIEGTRKFLINEVDRIISFDGTYVNKRHPQILVDSMVHTGEITSVRRDGIPRNVGPIAKMMFEDSVPNIIHSSVFSEIDNKASISSSVMLGTFSKIGTCASTVRSSEHARRNMVKRPADFIEVPIRKRKEVLII